PVPSLHPPPPAPHFPLFPYTTLFRSSTSHSPSLNDPRLDLPTLGLGGGESDRFDGRATFRAVCIWIDRDRRCRTHCERRRHQPRSDEHTSELQSRFDLVCRLLLEKKN